MTTPPPLSERLRSLALVAALSTWREATGRETVKGEPGPAGGPG